MKIQYVGNLSRDDPMYGYIYKDVLPKTGFHVGEKNFRVFRLLASHEVYLYDDEVSGIRLIGKFFTKGLGNENKNPAIKMEREYKNLHLLRNYGFCGYPHYVVRPLGCNAPLNNVLVEEYCYGKSLTHFIKQAILKQKEKALFEKLSALAYFFASLHNRTAGKNRVDFTKEFSYFQELLIQLKESSVLDEQELKEVFWLGECWLKKSQMWEDVQVIVHGDATPPNLLFGDGLWVIAIDLERMKYSDRVFDLGRLAGELKHFFMQYAHDKYRAEPFIGHFLWEYAGHFPDRDSAFHSLTERLPFYMGLNELRIARNSWFTPEYRKKLINEARLTLKSVLKGGAV